MASSSRDAFARDVGVLHAADVGEAEVPDGSMRHRGLLGLYSDAQALVDDARRLSRHPRTVLRRGQRALSRVQTWHVRADGGGAVQAVQMNFYGYTHRARG